MNRKDFIKILENYESSDYERPVVAELIEYIKTDQNCFKRIAKDGAKHIGASVLLENEKGEGLFLWHTKIQQWTPAGGHCDGNENILEVALTELEEETGIKNAKINKIPLEIRRYDYVKEIFGYEKSIYSITFLATINTADETPKICEPDKCEKMLWMTPQQVLAERTDIPYENPTHLIKQWIKKSVK